MQPEPDRLHKLSEFDILASNSLWIFRMATALSLRVTSQGDQADQRFVWLASGKPSWSPEEQVSAAILCFISALSATLWLIALAFHKQLALGTSDFDVASGHLMVVMTAKLFLKRQSLATNPFRPPIPHAPHSHTTPPPKHPRPATQRFPPLEPLDIRETIHGRN